jgi:hypothetical protein
MHRVALFKQKLREVGAILPGNSGDERNFASGGCHGGIGPQIGGQKLNNLKV